MTINPKSAALIVVDILQGADGDAVYSDNITEAEAAYRVQAKRVVDAARAASMPVVFACDAHIPTIDHELKLWGDHGLANTAAAEPAAFLGLADTDYVIRKRRYDSFFETGLDVLLRELGVDTVILIGADTNICVRHTACGAFYRALSVVVPTDATYTFLYGTQEEGEEYLRRIYAAELCTTDALCSALA